MLLYNELSVILYVYFPLFKTPMIEIKKMNLNLS
jgi:hypothetical protein